MFNSVPRQCEPLSDVLCIRRLHVLVASPLTVTCRRELCEIAGENVAATKHGFESRWGRQVRATSRKTWILLDQAVRALQERPGQRQSERLRRLEIDDQLELRRLLHGKIGGFHTLQNLVDVNGRAAVRVADTLPVGYEASGFHVRRRVGDRGQPVPPCEVGDLGSLRERYGILPHDNQCLCALTRCSREGAIEVLNAGHLLGLKLELQGTSGRFRFLVFEYGAPDVGVPESRHADKPGNGFLEKLEPLPAEL